MALCETPLPARLCQSVNSHSRHMSPRLGTGADSVLGVPALAIGLAR